MSQSKEVTKEELVSVLGYYASEANWAIGHCSRWCDSDRNCDHRQELETVDRGERARNVLLRFKKAEEARVLAAVYPLPPEDLYED